MDKAAHTKPPPRETLTALVFKAGERVPDWLLTYEAAGPGGHVPPTAFLFTQRCAIFESGAGVIVVPIEQPQSCTLLISGSDNCAFFAPERPLWLMGASTHFVPQMPLPEAT